MTSVELPLPTVLPTLSPSRKVSSVQLNDRISREDLKAPRVDRFTNADGALLE